MTIGEALAQELDMEAVTTRRVLERVPMEQIAWRPHPTARSLGELAMHVATLTRDVASLATAPSPVQVPESVPAGDPRSVEELLATLEESLAATKAMVSPLSDATMLETWRLVHGDHEIMAMPRVQMVRSAVLNHWYHHRGQLSVYLRQLGVPIPSIYGPSGDEDVFA